MRELLHGAGLLLAGFGWWRRRPGVMALGLVPAAIVGVVLSGLLVTLGVFLPSLTDLLTPFADGWPPVWSTVVRIAVGTALFGGAVVLSVVTFTALTLMVGEPFYDRIWQTVERDLGGAPEGRYGFWRAVGDAAGLLLKGIAIALGAALIGLIPVVGGVAGAVVGTVLTGWLLADELSARALTARGLDAAARRALRRGRRARALGFGVAAQLLFLVPLGAVVVMPAAVAGSTLLARELRGEPTQPASAPTQRAGA